MHCRPGLELLKEGRRPLLLDQGLGLSKWQLNERWCSWGPRVLSPRSLPVCLQNACILAPFCWESESTCSFLCLLCAQTPVSPGIGEARIHNEVIS